MVASEVIIFNHFNPVMAVFAIFAIFTLGLVGHAVNRWNSVGRELGDFFAGSGSSRPVFNNWIVSRIAGKSKMASSSFLRMGR